MVSVDIQNRTWACLPKEVRDNFRDIYQEPICDLAYKDALTDIFGKHNLTSDTEPEEMLIVERKRAIDLYSDALYSSNYSNYQRCRDIADGKIEMLQMLFDDKCLPNKN